MHIVAIKTIHSLRLRNTFSLIDKKLSRIEDPHYSEVIVFVQYLRSHLPKSEFY